MKIYISMLIFCFAAYGLSFAAPNASQVQRSIELIDQEEAFRSRFEQGEKLFIKEIEVKANVYIDKKSIKEIVLPYENRWISKDDLNRLIEGLRQFCAGLGYPIEQIDIFTEIISEKLEITINVSKPVK